MPLSASAAEERVESLFEDWRQNREHMALVNRWYRNTLNDEDKPSMPRSPTPEFKELRDRSITGWLKLAVTVVAQAMYVEGYRSADQSSNAAPWTVWQANRMDKRQNALHRGALSLGNAYASIMPGRLYDGTALPLVKGHSAKAMLAWYEDPATDEWPLEALRGDPIRGADGSEWWRMQLWDSEAVYTVDVSALGDDFTYITHELHGGEGEVCPIVRYTNDLDLDGVSVGEVEPNIDIVSRINQDTFDRLVVQRFQAWVVRYIAGMSLPEAQEEQALAKLKLSVEDILIAEDADTKFGTLPQAQLDGLIRARDADIRDFAVVTQTPPHDLLGAMVNLSADALAAAEAGKMRKVAERQHSFGESHEQLLRYSAWLMGDDEAAADFGAQVVWADTESRSLAQVADALGKMVTMLGVPPQVLWDRIPGVTQQDVEHWKAEAERGGSLESLLAELASGQVSPEVAAGGAAAV